MTSYFIEAFVFLFSLQRILAGVILSDKYIIPPLRDASADQAREASPEPESVGCIAAYVHRIADLESRLNSLKKKTTIAMPQAKKSAMLSQRISLLEDKISDLTAKIVHLEECNLYMIEVIEAASGPLSCKLSTTSCFLFTL
jgi:hypothetical protein